MYYGLVLYENEIYYKIGISNRNPEIRLKETGGEIDLIWAKYFEKGIDARRIEQKIINKFKHLAQTKHVFSGSTECFTEDISKQIDFNSLDNRPMIKDNP